MAEQDYRRINFNVPAELHHWLKAEALRQDTSITKLVRAAIEKEYLLGEQKQDD